MCKVYCSKYIKVDVKVHNFYCLSQCNITKLIRYRLVSKLPRVVHDSSCRVLISGTGNAMLAMVVEISEKLQLVLCNLSPGSQNALSRTNPKIAMISFKRDVFLIVDN